jgi:hypothetical protein
MVSLLSRGEAEGTESQDRPKDRGSASARALTRRCWRSRKSDGAGKDTPGSGWSTRNVGRGQRDVPLQR